MNESPPAGSRLAREVAGDHVDSLASRALSTVARTGTRTPLGPLPLFVDILRRACLNMAPDSVPRAIARIRAAGTSDIDIADIYVPEVARLLGEEWCADSLGFADVTIGTARLQGALRELGPEWRADHAVRPDAPCILIAVASDIYHTLGAVVLAGQMRRAGLSVRLQLGGKPDELADVLRRIRAQAVFLSASCGESLESLRKIVEAVRATGDPAPAVVIGGTIVGATQQDGVDLRALTGADFVTNDPDEALALCNISTGEMISSYSDPGG